MGAAGGAVPVDKNLFKIKWLSPGCVAFSGALGYNARGLGPGG